MLIYGKQSVNYVITHHANKVKKLYLAKEIDKKEYASYMKMGFEVKRIPPEAAGIMCKNGSHQGFLAEVSDFVLYNYRDFTRFDFVLVLVGLTDVGNIGAIVRTAYALGVDAIVASGVKSLAFEAVMRTSTGALFDMPFAIENNVHDVLNDLKMAGFRSYGADMGGVDVRTVTLATKRLLLLGGEQNGLSDRVISKLDEVVSIEMAHGFDSLNVSAAGAILIDRMRG